MGEAKFKLGNVVFCKGNGNDISPRMVIGYVNEPQPIGNHVVALNGGLFPAPNVPHYRTYTCYWYNNGTNTFNQFNFPEATLELVEANDNE